MNLAHIWFYFSHCVLVFEAKTSDEDAAYIAQRYRIWNTNHRFLLFPLVHFFGSHFSGDDAAYIADGCMASIYWHERVLAEPEPQTLAKPDRSPCVAVCCSVLQCVVVCCSVLHCVVLCCSVLQCVADECVLAGHEPQTLAKPNR